MTIYLLRSAHGYLSRIGDWTSNSEEAHRFVTSEAAHAAVRNWRLNGNSEALTVIVRDSGCLTSFAQLTNPYRNR